MALPGFQGISEPTSEAGRPVEPETQDELGGWTQTVSKLLDVHKGLAEGRGVLTVYLWGARGFPYFKKSSETNNGFFSIRKLCVYICMYVCVFVFVRTCTCGMYTVHTGMGACAYVCVQACRGQKSASDIFLNCCPHYCCCYCKKGLLLLLLLLWKMVSH